MTREYPDRPILAVGAVIFRGEEVLLIRRGKAPVRTDWSLPGGAQKTGETLDEALLREIREETGLEIDLKGHLTNIDFIERDGEGRVRYHYSLVDYWAEADGDPVAGGDAVEARFVPLAELDKYDMWEKTREAIETAASTRGARFGGPHQSFRGHLRTALLAALFGAGAYGFVNALRLVMEMLT